MNKQTQRRLNSGSLVLIAIAFVAAVVISNKLFSGLRLDLTEAKLYTLSEGTRRIVEGIDEPINLHFYFSDKATASIPSLRDYANRVRELLEEIENAASGKIILTVTDPLPFSEEEDRAEQLGLQGVGLPGTPDSVFLGLAGTDSVDNVEVISFFQPDKEAFLEYDIAKLISTLANPDRTVIGFISGVPMSGGFDPQTQQMSQPWMVYEQASQLFEIQNLGTSFDTIDASISVLWIVQPKNLSLAAQYAIDQFVMRGGKALVFVDPIAESDPAPQMQGMPQGMPPMGQASDLPSLFKAWGVTYSSSDVVADAQLALQLSAGASRQPVRHVGYIGLTPAQIGSSDVVTADLGSINLAIAGHFAKAEDASIDFEPLLHSTSMSQIMPSTRFSFLPDPSTLLNDFDPSGNEYVVAARITGVLKSAFPNGAPAMSVDSGEPAAEAPADKGSHLTETASAANLIIVADVDMLGDQMWVQVQNFFGQRVASAFAGNGAFVINALESLSGSSDLIGVRSRASYTRPFTKVEELRVEAESRYRQTEQRLQSELAETESRLGDLQSSREDTGNMIMTPEQQAEIDRFLDRRAEIRKELRAVQRELDKDIEQLGTLLKVINIAFVPLLLTAFALFAVWRRNRRSAS